MNFPWACCQPPSNRRDQAQIQTAPNDVVVVSRGVVLMRRCTCSVAPKREAKKLASGG